MSTNITTITAAKLESMEAYAEMDVEHATMKRTKAAETISRHVAEADKARTVQEYGLGLKALRAEYAYWAAVEMAAMERAATLNQMVAEANGR